MGRHPNSSTKTRESDLLLALLRERREATAISQQELSRRLGRTIAYVGKVEKGTRRLDVIEFLQILEQLDIDPGEFLKDLQGRLRQHE